MTPFPQQINFYREEFKKPVIILPARQIALLTLVAALLLVALGAYLNIAAEGMKKQLIIAQTQKENLTAQLQSLQDNYKEPTEDPALINQIRQLDLNIEQKQELANFLKTESSKIEFSFSAALQGLAEKHIEGLWLTEISIQSQGGRYHLRGVTQRAALIPDYIENLKTSTILRGTSFNLFDLERDSEDSELLHFLLSSERVEDGES